MEFLMDPSIWAGLLTLVVLEIVLGIDNLVFIAILADKLPPKQRDKARLLGLSLALIMRLGLLSLISWMVTLTKPLFTVMDFSFSGRDLIMLFGGIFLLFKATTELHERLENRDHDSGHGKGYASFWVVVTQIVILDAVFSLDAVITAVGMVNHPYCSNYRIQREDGVKDDNLCDDHPETGVAFTVAGIMIAVFQPFMQFGCCFEQQEYPPEQHNQVASGEGEIHDGK